MSRSCIWGGLLVAALTLTAGPTPAKDPALATDWNEAVLTIAEAEDGFMTLKGVRTVAMMHVAMHDALSSINGRFATHAFHGQGADADPESAAAQAAFRVASTQYPNQKTLQTLRDRWIGSMGNDAAIELGDQAAHAILSQRTGDGWDGEAQYQWHPMGPGVYAEFHDHSGTPQGFIFGAGWAKAKGFALTAPGQFRSPPPPAIDSDDYTQAFEEVKRLGRFQSMSRTPDQTHIALWWKDFVESSHNRLARDLIRKEGLPLQEATRLLALLNMAVFDAYVSSFDNKFHYNHWRPYTAIRWADNDGNEQTAPEASWTNTHRHTYAFPSYPSAHGTACAAAMTTLESVFGDDYDFTMRTPMVDIAGPFSGKIEMHPATRSFERFSDASTECGLSRVYLGIHFRYDSTAGVDLGNQVGRNVITTLMRSLDD